MSYFNLLEDCLSNDRYCMSGWEQCDPCAERDYQTAVEMGRICGCTHWQHDHTLGAGTCQGRIYIPTFRMCGCQKFDPSPLDVLA